MYTIHSVKKYNIPALLKVCDILDACGKDMAARYKLQHWNNSYLKNLLVLCLCILKNSIYLVCDEKEPIATFQIRKCGQSLLFQKLATVPACAGKGVGSFCVQEIEKIGRKLGCSSIICEVYDKSEHAIRFYTNRGFEVYGVTDTLKYKELKLEKTFRK